MKRKKDRFKLMFFVGCFFIAFSIEKSILAQETTSQTTSNDEPVHYNSVLHSAVPFLLIGPDARASAMADANVAISDNASAVFWNPAGLGFQSSDGFEAIITHNQWLPSLSFSDLVIENLFARYGLENFGLVGTGGIGITFLNQGENIATDEFGNEITKFYSYELAIWLSYGIQVTPGLSVGGSIRFVHSSLVPGNVASRLDVFSSGGSGVASSISFDVGLLWKPFFLGWMRDRFSLGFNLSNIGPKVKYISENKADPLPTNLRLGVAFQPWKTDYHVLTLTVDFNRLIITRVIDPNTNETVSHDVFSAFISTWGAYGIEPVTVGIGAEYWYGKPKLVSFRVGYFHENEQAGSRRYISFGLGVKYWALGIDFSYIQPISINGQGQESPLSSTIRASLLINLDVLKVKSKKKKNIF